MKSNKKRLLFVLAILTMALVLSFVFVACNKTDRKDPGDKDLIEPPKKELSASEIYSQVNPSVAFVLIENLSGYSSGSGFFIDSNGTLITNYHVIDDGLSGAIQLYDGTVATIDSVIGYDKNLDIAILSTSAKNTTPVKIADSIVQIGETVYAIGYPEAFKLGFSSSTFTSGMVSMNRSIEGYSYIQSTVNITHGNSGGALINKYGEVVGITTSGITYGNIDYMNLSIPIQRIDTVSRTANEPLVIVTRRKYPVYATFYSDGAKYTTQTLSYEGRASVPTAPVKAGYTLDGWYTDNSFTEKFDFNKKITSDVSIYAKWSTEVLMFSTYNANYALVTGYNGNADNVVIPKTYRGIPVKAIKYHAFSGCTGLTSITLPDSVTNIGKNAFYNTAWYNNQPEGLVYAGKVAYRYKGTMPSNTSIVLKEGTLGIAGSAFYDCTGLTNITIPDSVTSIGDYAFSNCKGLMSVTIPDSVTSIGDHAFLYCTELTSVTIPDSVTSIGSSAFSGCTGLTNITIPDRVTSIGDWAFHGCTVLTSVAIGNSVTSIGNGAFYNTAWYNNQPDGLVYAGKVAYKYKGTMPSNTSIVLKEGTLGIAASAFYDCTSLTSVTIPDSVTSIGSSAFSGCSGLTSVTIGNSVTNIGAGAFSGTAWYNNQPDGLVYAGKVAYKYKGTMPSNTSIVLKEGTLSIAGSAFDGCRGLTNITIPDSVTSIGGRAFSGCTSLTDITFNGTKAQWIIITKGSNWRYNVPSSYVHCSDGII